MSTTHTFWRRTNKHYYDAEGMVTIEVEGSLGLQYDPTFLDDNQIPKLVQIGVEQLHSIEIVEEDYGKIFHTGKEY